jgi:GMP synthase (glutamine-hydrolysing)
MILFVQIDPEVPAGLFARHLAERGVPHALWAAWFEPEPPPGNCAGVIILGGRMGVHDDAVHPCLVAVKAFMAELVALDTPLLGICLGGQLLAHQLGGNFYSNFRGEKGVQPLRLTAAGERDPLFTGLPPQFPAYAWHNDSFDPPAKAQHLATSPACPGQAFRLGRAWGLQFHPEVDDVIVAAWSKGTGSNYPAQYAAHRQELRQLALHLLDNFVALAEPGA